MRCQRLGWFALAALGCSLLGSPALTRSSAEPARVLGDAFIVHEWGTFSTFSGSNGAFLKFYPNDGDLPEFVHNRHQIVKGGLPDALVSLETPVMYFYTDRERTASVRVDFPKGMMTDWYPETSRPAIQGLTWDGLRISTSTPAEAADESVPPASWSGP